MNSRMVIPRRRKPGSGRTPDDGIAPKITVTARISAANANWLKERGKVSANLDAIITSYRKDLESSANKNQVESTDLAENDGI